MRIAVSRLTSVLVPSAILALPLAAQDLDDPGLTFDVGPGDAAVTVVAFEDFGCHFCARFTHELFPTISREFIETGRVRWRLLLYDQRAFRHSERALKAAICADNQQVFWPMHDRLFAEQTAWMRERRPENTFTGYAAEVGADTVAFRECLGEKDTDRRADDLRKLARRSRIPGTPTFFVNDERIIGLQPIETFRAMLNDAIAEAEETPPPSPRR